jgi:hypothetical protein
MTTAIRRKRIILCAVLLVVVPLGGWLGFQCYRYVQAVAFLGAAFGADSGSRSWRGYLPTNATEISEWSWSDGFLPDYSYVLKARVTPANFDSFCSELGLTLHTTNRHYADDPTWLSWSAPPGFTSTWWNPSPTLENTYVSQSNDTWSFAKYENGFLYFQSLNH